MDEKQLGSLAADALEGDPAAFARLVAATATYIHRVATRLCSAAEADDVVQETYVRAFVAVAEGRYQERGGVRPWLRRIAVRVALDGKRAQQRRRAREAAWAPSPHDESHSETAVRLGEVEATLRQLPANQRVALVLKEVEGMTTKEIAEAMGCSSGAVEQRLVRARAALRARLSHD